MLYKTARRLYNIVILKKITNTPNVIEFFAEEINSSHVISSPSAWNLVQKQYSCTPSSILLDQPLQYCEIKKKKIKESIIFGIGGGRSLDIAKSMAKLNKKKCILIPTILSTTAWLNPMASLKDKEKVYHAPGKFNQTVIDPELIAQSPQHLNIGGMADILCGYNSLSDWVLANEIAGERMPKKALDLVLNFLNDIKNDLKSHIPIDSSSIVFITNCFKEALGLCWGLLSGRPVEGSEHFLYYLLEETYNRPMNHGAIIALNTLVCLKLRGQNSLIDPSILQKFYDDIGIKYRLSEQDIPLEIYREALETIQQFVIDRKMKFSLWNLENPYENCSIQEILDWIE